MSLIDNGDDLNAASLDQALVAQRAFVNAITLADVAPHAMSEEHLPSPLSDFIARTSLGITGGHRELNSPIQEMYHNFLPPNNTHPSDYTSVNLSGGDPFGPTTLPLDAGWRVPAWTGDDTKAAKVTFTDTDGLPDLTTRGLRGIRVRFSVETAEDDAEENAVEIGDMIAGDDHKVALVLAIGWCDTNGDFFCIKRSVRYFSLVAVALGRVSTFTTIRQTDIAASVTNGNGEVRHIVGYIAWKNLQATTAVTTGQAIAGYNLSVRPLFAGELT